MTLVGAQGTVIQPVPPSQPQRPGKRRLAGNQTAEKRFSVRDGFHLHERNQELKDSIDRQLFPSSTDASPDNRSEHDSGAASDAGGPSTLAIPCSSRNDTSSSGNNRKSDADHDPSALPASIVERLSIAKDHKPAGFDRNATETLTEASLKASAEWLIYRHRPHDGSQWQQVKMDKLLRDTLQQPLLSETHPLQKENEVSTPSRPRHQSTLGSTYGQRVVAARPQQYQLLTNRSRRVFGGGIVTDTERRLAHSREARNKDVDRLLVSLFQSPTPSLPTDTGSPAANTPFATTTRFATRRSELREQTATALKSRNLRSRVDELRSLPELIDKIETMQRLKQQQLIEAHGEDLVLKNRNQARLSVLQRPAETPVFPSVIEQRQQQAAKRKKELDAAQETTARNAVSRWQKRRILEQETAQQRFRESQWLLIAALAKSSIKWLTAFHNFKQKRDALRQIFMARKIQRYWRQQTLARKMLALTPMTPISSPFFRMPHVLQAIHLIQQFIRLWIDTRRKRERNEAIAIIVTSWFEFQDVKFRRLILRFRKRVRHFQFMWREWRAITDARVKLLLLVWTKLETKSKRRHGLLPLTDTAVQPTTAAAQQSGYDSLSVKTDTGVTLIEYFRESGRGGVGSMSSILPREPKHFEGVHRHLRNCGTVQAPIVAVVAAGGGQGAGGVGPLAAAVTTLRPTTPLDTSSPQPQTVKRNLQLMQNMGEEFQLAMFDYYNTTTTSPRAAAKPSTPRQRPTSPRGNELSPNSLSSPTHKNQGGSPKRKPNLPMLAAQRRQQEKIPMQLKLTLLRQLLSEKRRLFREKRDKKRCGSLYSKHGSSFTVLTDVFIPVAKSGKPIGSTRGKWSSGTTCWTNSRRFSASRRKIRSSCCSTASLKPKWPRYLLKRSNRPTKRPNCQSNRRRLDGLRDASR